VSAACLLVIQHEDDCPPDWFGEWLADADVRLDVRQGHLGDEVPTALDDRHAGLIVLGGEMGAYDDADHPWLTPTKALIKAVVEDGRPFLGICLGQQLAAVALGGEVIANPAGQALGLTPVAPNEAGVTDELLSAVRLGVSGVQWNRDVVSRLPVGAVELAKSPDGTPQAIRFGRSAWGVQFHPEVSPTVFESWVYGAREAPTPEALAALARIYAAEQQLRADWRPFAGRFADIVARVSVR
jgi:GMP synthase (glutamine-hydrolysing)